MSNLVYQCFVRPANKSTKRLPTFVTHSTRWCKTYAQKVGADYLFETGLDLKDGNRIADPENMMHRYFNILHVLDPKFDEYDNVLYLDTDIVPDGKAKNIFSIVKPDIDLYIASEGRVPGSTWGPGFLGAPKVIQEFVEKYERFGLKAPKDKKGLLIQYNTGVVVFPKHTRIFLRENLRPWMSWAEDPLGDEFEMRSVLNNDQPFLNGEIKRLGLKVHDLGWRWNLFPPQCCTIPCYKAHFYHFSGGAKRYMEDFTADHTPEGYYFHPYNKGYRNYSYKEV